MSGKSETMVEVINIFRKLICLVLSLIMISGICSCSMYITQDEWDEANSRRLITNKAKKSIAEVRSEIDERSDVQGAARQSAGERSEQLDWKKAEQTNILGTPNQPNPLTGCVIVLDPGHQMFENDGVEQLTPGDSKKTTAKSTVGALGVWSGYPEYVYVLQFCELLKSQLESIGAQVYMTRTENDVDISGKERALIANDLNAGLMVSIHSEYYDDPAIQGFSVTVPSFECIENIDLLVESKLIGTYINMELAVSTGNMSRGLIEREDVTELNWSDVPAVRVELGCLSNEGDDVSLQADSYKQALLDGLANGILKYYLDRAIYQDGEKDQSSFEYNSEDDFFSNSFERSGNEANGQNW